MCNEMEAVLALGKGQWRGASGMPCHTPPCNLDGMLDQSTCRPPKAVVRRGAGRYTCVVQGSAVARVLMMPKIVDPTGGLTRVMAENRMQ
jgi:hypothetical protein